MNELPYFPFPILWACNLNTYFSSPILFYLFIHFLVLSLIHWFKHLQSTGSVQKCGLQSLKNFCPVFEELQSCNLAACSVFPFKIEIGMLFKNFISDLISLYYVMHSWLFVFTLSAWSLKTTVVDTNLNSTWEEQSLGLPLFQTLILESLSTSHGNWRHGVWEPRLEWVSWWENACTLTEWGYGSRIKYPG